MSGLTLPRIIFSGTTSWNPNTVNNSPRNYDENTVEPVLGDKTFAEYAAWLIQMNRSGTDVNGSWNVYGDFGVAFNPVTVTGVQPAVPNQGQNQDPLIGKPVQILSQGAPRMVDIDPYGPYTTQVVFHSLSLGDDNVGVSGPAAYRIGSRWPDFTRNLNETNQLIIAGSMGVVWQAALPKESLTWNGVESSPALAALKEALEADPANQGLIFLFASYRTLYYQTVTWEGQRVTGPQQLATAYQGGFKEGNPALSMTLGRVGVWGPGELASVPTGDLLLTPVNPVTTASVPLARNVRPEGRLGELAEAQQLQVMLGPAQARLDRSRNVVVLDFLATFPEADASLTKAVLGSFVLQAVGADGQTTPIGEPITFSEYDRQAYESGGGIVEVSFADNPELADVIANGTLQLVSAGPTATVALQQVALVSETDQRGLWLDEGTTGTIQVRSYQNGATPPSEEVQLLVVPYDSNFELIQDPSQAVFEIVDGSGQPLPLAPVLPVGPDGSTSFTVRPLQAGIGYYFFFPFTGADQPTPPSSIPSIAPDQYFAALRALPFDNELNESTPDSDLTWQFIYDNVLSTWDVVYPLMSTIIPLSNQQAVDQAAAAIAFRVDLDPFTASQYMPIARDMSAGKKKLLLRYLALQQGEGNAPT